LAEGRTDSRTGGAPPSPSDHIEHDGETVEPLPKVQVLKSDFGLPRSLSEASPAVILHLSELQQNFKSPGDITDYLVSLGYERKDAEKFVSTLTIAESLTGFVVVVVGPKAPEDTLT
jgi:hypothetical protein